MTVTRSDLESKARQISQVVAETKESAQNTAVAAGIGVVLLVGLAYVMGRRKGRNGRAVVEVYKV
ncbi:MAG TPA: LPXTG cell wall anchor domain-containing protein [Acidimicrobiia bacterium]|jgi:LPXTG-motif cell wall-anchored protein